MPEYKCCEHCGGSGRLLVEYFIRFHYQDCSEYKGPFATKREAEFELAKQKKGQQDPSCQVYIVEQLTKISSNTPSPGAITQ